VVGALVQKRNSVHHSYCIGSGKLRELKSLVEEKDVEKVIFTNALPSSQIFKVQRELGGDVKVIDRNLLILEVFDSRAMTMEAKLQIKLAQLRYTFSWGREYLKMKGILGEQVGWSGPGDYPFKEYEKAARKRISKIAGKLAEIRLKKDLLRYRRRELGYPLVALAGYTQSGKTTFFNRVTCEGKNVGLGPFTTLTTFVKKVEAAAHGLTRSFLLIDSIGFVEDMHPIIIDAFDSTLKEIAYADMVLLFLDAGDNLQTFTRKASSSNVILRRIGVKGEVKVCVNKMDLSDRENLNSMGKVARKLYPGSTVHFISAKTGKNVDKLLRAVDRGLNRWFKAEEAEAAVQGAASHPS
jgi:GTP-binding protein HflX